MVNITKRMHKLMPKLWRVKGGPGAASLEPRPSRPTVTSIRLRIPNPASQYDIGAHAFWRRHLQAIRYHNLNLPIIVEQRTHATSDFAPTLTLNFEAATRETLEKNISAPLKSDTEAFSERVKQLQEWREKREQQRRKAVKSGTSVSTSKKDIWDDQQRKQTEEVGIPEDCKTKLGEITAKPQPPVDPSAPSTTSPPKMKYERSVTLGLRGRTADEIWSWFRGVTQAQKKQLSLIEVKAKEEHKVYEVQARVDRRRVKEGIDAMKKEREDLRRAKAAAERAAEA